MDAWVWIVIAVIVIALIAYVAWTSSRKRRLSDRYGPEYDRTVKESGSDRKAMSELRAREKRREALDIRPLDTESRDRFGAAWRDAQTRFVDTPDRAVGDADRLVQDVMRQRGYPVDDFEQRSADISVDHPRLVDDYRAAHAISLANDHGEASTEDLRQAMVHYRALFVELLEAPEQTPSA